MDTIIVCVGRQDDLLDVAIKGEQIAKISNPEGFTETLYLDARGRLHAHVNDLRALQHTLSDGGRDMWLFPIPEGNDAIPWLFPLTPEELGPSGDFHALGEAAGIHNPAKYQIITCQTCEGSGVIGDLGGDWDLCEVCGGRGSHVVKAPQAV